MIATVFWIAAAFAWKAWFVVKSRARRASLYARPTLASEDVATVFRRASAPRRKP